MVFNVANFITMEFDVVTYEMVAYVAIFRTKMFDIVT